MTRDIDPHTRRVILFDFDGTVADTKGAIVSTATRALIDHGLAPEELGDVSRLIGPPFPEAFSQVYGLSAQAAQDVTNRYRAIYSTLGLSAWPLFDGMRELVAGIRSQGRLACVATSKLHRVLDRALHDEGMESAFDLAIGKPDDKPFGKAETIRLVMDTLHATPDECLMVGDRHHDVEGALACGVPCVGVTYGDTGDYEELAGAGACHVVDTVQQLTELLL